MKKWAYQCCCHILRLIVFIFHRKQGLWCWYCGSTIIIKHLTCPNDERSDDIKKFGTQMFEMIKASMIVDRTKIIAYWNWREIKSKITFNAKVLRWKYKICFWAACVWLLHLHQFPKQHRSVIIERIWLATGGGVLHYFIIHRSIVPVSYIFLEPFGNVTWTVILEQVSN